MASKKLTQLLISYFEELDLPLGAKNELDTANFLYTHIKKKIKEKGLDKNDIVTELLLHALDEVDFHAIAAAKK